uniref:Fibrinogen C-terminal domain-containing protein n=1 Tax=Macrostomum lignano TaxID=282301 RepID=A0A1I8FMC6_9PLAT
LFQLRVSAALALLLCSLAAGQVSQCSPADSRAAPRFVAQLSVNGCALFVHDTGASDGPHLAVEPLMTALLAEPADLCGDTCSGGPAPSFTARTDQRTAVFQMLPDGRWFVKIQQRLTGRVSFQRNWTEYETGFGDGTDFWIGLSAIHSLSQGGVTLRVEMKLWRGSELHAEYAGFQVGDASTGYRMTYREMLRDRSSVSIDALKTQRGMRVLHDGQGEWLWFMLKHSWKRRLVVLKTAITPTLTDFFLREVDEITAI